jgi:hypothetical protein
MADTPERRPERRVLGAITLAPLASIGCVVLDATQTDICVLDVM